MAVGNPATRLDAWLAQYNTAYVQLHTADPGAAGTANVSAQAPTRKLVDWGVDETNTGVTPKTRRRRNDAIVRWDGADVGGTEAIDFWSLWSAASAGTFLQSGALAATLNLAAGVPAEIPINGIEVNAGPLAE